jgi:hypothetical protein
MRKEVLIEDSKVKSLVYHRLKTIGRNGQPAVGKPRLLDQVARLFVLAT